MKCPHCEKEIPGSSCPECGVLNPDEANYCMDCGLSLKQKGEETAQEEDVLDLENRVLCSDGTCTGIVIDGKCTECGKSPVYEKDTKD